MRIEADRDACIGSGNCVMVAGAVFDQGDDGLVQPLVDEVPDEELAHAREAVKLCPAGALRLVD
jgi:ferredoxin